MRRAIAPQHCPVRGSAVSRQNVEESPTFALRCDSASKNDSGTLSLWPFADEPTLARSLLSGEPMLLISPLALTCLVTLGSSPTIAARPPIETAAEAVSTPLSAQPLVPSSVSIPRAEWVRFIAALRKNLARNEPRLRDNEVVGVVYHGRQLPAADRIGLMEGDFLVRVNGNAFSGYPREFLGIEMDRAAAACVLSVTIEKDGVQQTVGAHCS